MLCKYGCSNEGKFKNKDGSVRCSKNPSQCPVNIEKRVKTRQKTGYGHSAETKEKISKAGIDGAHHIDHIVSVREGFEKSIPVEDIADPTNLQVITWLDNIRKYDGKGKRKNSI
jgi:hypothetical protein